MIDQIRSHPLVHSVRRHARGVTAYLQPGYGLDGLACDGTDGGLEAVLQRLDELAAQHAAKAAEEQQ